MHLLEQDSFLGSPEPISWSWWDHRELCATILDPLTRNFHTMVFILVSSVQSQGGGRAEGVLEFTHRGPPCSLTDGICRLQASSSSDSQSSSDTIVSMFYLPPSGKLHLVQGWWVGKTGSDWKIPIIPDLFVLGLDFSH